MRHLDEGVLRRIRDDRFAASNAERAHLGTCPRCQARMERVSADASLAERLLATGAGVPAAVDPALAQLRARMRAQLPGAELAPPARPRLRGRRWAIVLVAAPLLAIALVVSANAAGWLSIFSPTTVAPFIITTGELSGLPDLSAYGRMHVVAPPTHEVGSAAAASAETGLPALDTGPLPAGVPAAVRWEVIGAGSATFTIDAATARAAAAAAGRPAPQIPAALDGASITVDAGPAVVGIHSSGSGEPTLVVGETNHPTASTNGATLAELETFLVAQQGVSAQLAAEIRAIGRPASTLPIPVITGVTTSRTLTIHGVQGVVTGDASGLGTAVIWERDGVVYAVAGLLPEDEVVSIAQSLS